MRALRGLCALLSLWAGACTHSVHQFTVTGTMPPPGPNVRLVTVQAAQDVVIATTQYELYDDAYRKLLAACAQGDIVGIRMKHWTDHNFLSWRQNLRLEGSCVTR